MSAWWEIVRDTLKKSEVKLVTYVPDNVLNPLIKAIHDDDYFNAFVCTREEEAIGIVAGAWMGGMRGCASTTRSKASESGRAASRSSSRRFT